MWRLNKTTRKRNAREHSGRTATMRQLSTPEHTVAREIKSPQRIAVGSEAFVHQVVDTLSSRVGQRANATAADSLVVQEASVPCSPHFESDIGQLRPKTGWFTKVCIWVAVRLTCCHARTQRSGTRTRNREGREADYDEDTSVESCNSELNQAPKTLGFGT